MTEPAPTNAFCRRPTSYHTAVIDPVLDDGANPRRGGHSVKAVLRAAEMVSLAIDWALETHTYADTFSGAPFIKACTGAAAVGIGEHIRDVQRIFRPVFNATDLRPDGSDVDRLFRDGERYRIWDLEAEVPHVPGHTPADVAYKLGDAVFVGDTLFMPEHSRRRSPSQAAPSGVGQDRSRPWPSHDHDG